MKKLVLSMAIAGALGLSGCDSETIKDVEQDVAQNGPATLPKTRVVFDPSSGVLSVPNDLLFSGTTDGTLNLPVDDPTDFSDPLVAANALDGWSTNQPFPIDIALPAGVSLDGDSVFNPASVRIFEANMGGATATTAECQAVSQGSACNVVGELTFGTDFVAQLSGSSIAIVPLKPLKAKTSYILVLTDSIMDSQGQSIAGSTSYESVRQDINTHPMGSESQLGLQAIINSFENVVSDAGVNKDSIIYTAAITTQSTVDAVATVKSVMAQNAAAGNAPLITVADSGASVLDVLTLNGVEIPASVAPVYSTGNYFSGSIELPYYLGVPTAENPTAPVNQWWLALCDSAVTLAGLGAQNPAAIPAEPVSEDDAMCMALSAAAGLPAPGLRDLGIDAERNITQFNPLPQARAMMNLDVQMTTPDVTMANAVRAAQGLDPIAEPATGWPVVMLQHGITSKKEDMLLITGILSMNGFATVAIDHPLHGSRGFDLNGDGVDDLNASTVSSTHYMNLANLLTTRDNLRQSTVDMLGLRMGLNFVFGADINGSPVNVDSSQVHFLGHSLGAITGINFMAMANLPLDPAVDPLFKVATNSLAMPGVGVANFLLDSPAFGDLIKAFLVSASVPEFAAMLPENPTEAELVATFQAFYAGVDDVTRAELDGTFAQFAFAAQSVTDAGDPVNYAGILAATQTPTHLIEVVGNGTDNLPDQVIPNAVSSSPTSGTEAAIALLGLPGVSESTQGSGAVRFTAGHHGSILDPSARPESPDPLLSAATTSEMQAQVTTFFATLGQLISVSNTDVVQ
ncbi:MAG: lipase [Thalassotalea sp.]|nr:lipase [Thalassotalea sp.]